MNEIQRAGGHVLTLDFSADPKEKFAKNTDISWVRRIVMDDRAASVVGLPSDKFLSEAELARIKKVLPEAKIIRLPKDFPTVPFPPPHK
jgi:hypothetical protein